MLLGIIWETANTTENLNVDSGKFLPKFEIWLHFLLAMRLLLCPCLLICIMGIIVLCILMGYYEIKMNEHTYKVLLTVLAHRNIKKCYFCIFSFCMLSIRNQFHFYLTPPSNYEIIQDPNFAAKTWTQLFEWLILALLPLGELNRPLKVIKLFNKQQRIYNI